jgi:hypothetical protein
MNCNAVLLEKYMERSKENLRDLFSVERRWIFSSHLYNINLKLLTKIMYTFNENFPACPIRNWISKGAQIPFVGRMSGPWQSFQSDFGFMVGFCFVKGL